MECSVCPIFNVDRQYFFDYVSYLNLGLIPTGHALYDMPLADYRKLSFVMSEVSKKQRESLDGKNSSS